MTNLAEIIEEIQEVQDKRDALLKRMKDLKTKSLKGKINSMDYLKKFDIQSEDLRLLQEELRLPEKKRQKYELLENVQDIMKENYLRDEEVIEIISTKLKISIPTEKHTLYEFLFQLTQEKLTTLLELLEELVSEFEEEEIQKRKTLYPDHIEVSMQNKEKIEADESFELESALKPEDLFPKEGSTSETSLPKEKLLEKFKEIDDIEPFILDKVKDRKSGPLKKQLPLKDVSLLTELPSRFQLKTEFIGFKEFFISRSKHPNLVHHQILDFLEDIGYYIEEHVFPLPELIEIEENKSLMYNFLGSIKGVIRCERSSSHKGYSSIHVLEEGITSISHRKEKNPLIDSKEKLIFAGKVKNMKEEELIKDINILEKIIKEAFDLDLIEPD